jgi:hypothetical protein
VSSDFARKKKGGKAKAKGKSGKEIQANYDIHIPDGDNKKKDKSEKKNKDKAPKAPKEPKEPKDKSGQTLASACEAVSECN